VGLLHQVRPGLALGLVTVTQLLHAAQPDAGQALAFLLGVLVLFGGARSLSTGWKVAGCGLAAMGVALACAGAAPLDAMPHVERIVHLAAYFLGALAVTQWGNYPVPVMGAGAGPVLGWYAALGILLCAERAAN
jgi:hypothetical protein